MKEIVTMSLADVAEVSSRRLETLPHVHGHHELLSEVPVVLADPILKRPIDVIVATIGILLSAPLWIIVAAAIWLEDRGPILYTQMRWGRGGRCFDVYKFRTMIKDSDERFGIVQATKDDPRITRVGRLLRATGLDELPQLVNILKGQMSFVGPRALALGEYIQTKDGRKVPYEDAPGFHERLGVKPGLTGLATIYLPKDASPEHKFDTDLAYIRDRSTWMDIRLIALSLWLSVRGRWEVRTSKI